MYKYTLHKVEAEESYSDYASSVAELLSIEELWSFLNAISPFPEEPKAIS